MKNLTTQIKLGLSLAVIAISAVFNFIFLKVNHSETQIIYSRAIEVFAESNRQSALLIDLFGEQKDVEVYKSFKKTLEQQRKYAKTFLEGGEFKTQSEVYNLVSVKNKKVRAKVDKIMLDIDLIEDNLKIFEKETDGTNFVIPKTWDERHKSAYKFTEGKIIDLRNNIDELGQSVRIEISRTKLSNTIISTATILFILIFSVVTYVLTRKHVYQPLNKAIYQASQIAEGKRQYAQKIGASSEFDELRISLNHITERIEEAAQFAQNIGEGRFDNNFNILNNDDLLGKALVEMRDKLRHIADAERKRNWAVNGLAQFSEILRANQHQSLAEVSFVFIQNLVRYTECNQGAVYVLQSDSDTGKDYIELTSAYAYEKRKFTERRLELREGLVGQCILERNTIYTDKIPQNYLRITSGLGEATPTVLFICPIMVNENIEGAIEIASFTPIEDYKQEFIKQVCQGLASTVAAAKVASNTQKLLEAAQRSNEELAAKEEQMRQNAEELNATQEELNRKLRQLEIETNLTNCIIEAINKTNATIEFDLQGNILEVNEMYLSVMGYKKSDLVGKNEVDMVPMDELNTQKYQLMWESLRTGSFHSGEYRRISKDGKEIWLNGTYNPIVDIDGKAYKVIQFAQFTTEEKERELDLTSKINAISTAFPLIDLDVNGVVLSVNGVFVNLSGYKRLQLRNKKFVDLLNPEPENENRFDITWKAVISGENTQTQIDIVNSESDVINCIAIFTPVKNLSGIIYKIQCTLVNISEEKKLQIELIKRQTEQLTLLTELEQAKDNLENQKFELESRMNLLNDAGLIFELDYKLRITQLNRQLCEKLGCEERQILKTDFRKLIDHSPEDVINKIFADLNAGSVSKGTLHLTGPVNKSFWGDTIIVPVKQSGNQSGPLRFIGLISDVTQRVREYQSLLEKLNIEKLKTSVFGAEFSNAKEVAVDAIAQSLSLLLSSGADLGATLESSDLLAILIDTNGKVVNASKSALELFDSKLKENDSELFNIISHPNNKISDLFEKVLSGELVTEKLGKIDGLDSVSITQFTALPVFSELPRDNKILILFL